jgi:hypothetical protein
MVSLGWREYGSIAEEETAATFVLAKAPPDIGHTVPLGEAPAMPGAARRQAKASKKALATRWTCKLRLPSGFVSSPRE